MDVNARVQARVQRELQRAHHVHLDEWLSAAEKAGVLLTEPVPQSRSQVASGVSVEWLLSLSKSLLNSQLNVPTTASVKQVLQHALHKHPACELLDLVPQEHVSYASVYVSHSWGNDFFSLVRVLEQDLELKWQAHLGFLDEKARSKGKSLTKENDARAVQDLLAEEARQAEADLVERRRQAFLASSSKPPQWSNAPGNTSFNNASPRRRLSSNLPPGHPTPASRLPNIATKQTPTDTAASFPPAQPSAAANQGPPRVPSLAYASTDARNSSNKVLPSIRQRANRRSSMYGDPDGVAARDRRVSKLSSLHSSHTDLGSQRSGMLAYAADDPWRESVELSPSTGLPRVSVAAPKMPLSVSMDDLESAKRRRPKQLQQQLQQQQQQHQTSPTSPPPTSPHPTQPVGPHSPPATPVSPLPSPHYQPQSGDAQLQQPSWDPSSPGTPAPNVQAYSLAMSQTNVAMAIGNRQDSLPALLEGHAGLAEACARGAHTQVKPSAVAAAPAGSGQFHSARLRSRGKFTDMEALKTQHRGKVPVIDPPGRKNVREMLLRNQMERDTLINNADSEVEWLGTQGEEGEQGSAGNVVEEGRTGEVRVSNEGRQDLRHSTVTQYPAQEQGSGNAGEDNQHLQHQRQQSPLQQQQQQPKQHENETNPGGQTSPGNTARRLKGSVSWKPVLTADHKKEIAAPESQSSQGHPPPQPPRKAAPLGLPKEQLPQGQESIIQRKGKEENQAQDGAPGYAHTRADQGVKIQRTARRSSGSGSQVALTPEQAKEARLRSYKQQFVGYFVWLDVLALPSQQGKRHPTAAVVNTGRLIHCIGRVFVILDPNLEALSCAWVLYEVWLALKHRRSVHTLSTFIPIFHSQGNSKLASFKSSTLTGPSQHSAGSDALPETLDLQGSKASSEKQHSAILTEFFAEVDSPRTDIFSLENLAAHIRECLESARILELRRDLLVQSLYTGLSRCCFTYQFEDGTPPAQKQIHATISPFMVFAEGRFKQEMLHDSALRVTHGHDPEFYLWKLLVFLQQQLTAARSEPVWISLLGKYAAIAERSFSARFSNGVVNEMMGAVGGVFDVNLLRQYCKSICSSQRTVTHNTSIMETSSESADEEDERGFRSGSLDNAGLSLSLRELE